MQSTELSSKGKQQSTEFHTCPEEPNNVIGERKHKLVHSDNSVGDKGMPRGWHRVAQCPETRFPNFGANGILDRTALGCGRVGLRTAGRLAASLTSAH